MAEKNNKKAVLHTKLNMRSFEFSFYQYVILCGSISSHLPENRKKGRQKSYGKYPKISNT